MLGHLHGSSERSGLLGSWLTERRKAFLNSTRFMLSEIDFLLLLLRILKLMVEISFAFPEGQPERDSEGSQCSFLW